jgi:hypothetical protein
MSGLTLTGLNYDQLICRMLKTQTVLLRTRVERDHCEGAVDEDITVLDLLTFFRCLCDLHGNL